MGGERAKFPAARLQEVGDLIQDERVIEAGTLTQAAQQGLQCVKLLPGTLEDASNGRALLLDRHRSQSCLTRAGNLEDQIRHRWYQCFGVSGTEPGEDLPQAVDSDGGL